MKKLLLIVIDALTPRVLLPAMESGQLPNLKILAEKGMLDPKCSTIFPSITHAALSSIATGSYPKIHGIPGGYWFDVEENGIVHYTDDIWAIMNGGVSDFFHDMLVLWNRERIKADTIFEIVERAGHRAACINHLVHRGLTEHEVNIPLFANLLPGVSQVDTFLGPSMLYIGDLVKTPLADNASPSELPPDAGLMRRFGLDDQYGADMLLYLAENRAFPDFTLAYFMDNDYESHKDGPKEAVAVLEQFDTALGKLTGLYGGIDKFLDEFCIIITGDHSQIKITSNEEKGVIVLDDLLSEFQIAPVGTAWSDEDELVICPNMRTIHIYVKQCEKEMIERIAERLQSDTRVDQTIWRATLTEPNSLGYVVIAQDRGKLHFWPGEADGENDINHAVDEWGCSWCWQGDLSALDARVDDGVVKFDTYPNAFERIAGVLDAPNGGHIWATAHPGIDFQLETSTVHIGGGSHGSLHKLDSHVPLLLAGAPDGILLPNETRTVDVLPLCLSILGIDSEHNIGASHVHPA